MGEYPHESGDVIVLGPQVFVSRDETVLNWKGCNYVPQEDTTEWDRLREVLAGIVFYLGPVSSPRSARDPADGDGVIAYSHVPALVAAAVVERDRLRGVVDAAKLATGRLTRRAEGAEAERDRLWAVVDAVRVMWDNIVGTADDAVMGFPATDYLAIEEALDQLDVEAEATDG